SFMGTQVWGVLAMGAAVVLIVFLPWLDRSPIKSVRYRGSKFKVMLTLFVIAFVGLGILGALPPTDVRTYVARTLSVIYFAFFIGMPFYTKNDAGKIPVPTRVTESTARGKALFFVLWAVLIAAAVLFAKNI
ncbi:MAG: cytochrome bc complex cytochrome b subunit, partial [Paludibacterium sp.]|nr:cytochrome bc complex cytochrome b subunit [Paludibacterium sp.]